MLDRGREGLKAGHRHLHQRRRQLVAAKRHGEPLAHAKALGFDDRHQQPARIPCTAALRQDAAGQRAARRELVCLQLLQRLWGTMCDTATWQHGHHTHWIDLPLARQLGPGQSCRGLRGRLVLLQRAPRRRHRRGHRIHGHEDLQALGQHVFKRAHFELQQPRGRDVPGDAQLDLALHVVGRRAPYQRVPVVGRHVQQRLHQRDLRECADMCIATTLATNLHTTQKTPRHGGLFLQQRLHQRRPPMPPQLARRSAHVVQVEHQLTRRTHVPLGSMHVMH